MVRSAKVARIALTFAILLVCFLGFRLWLRGNTFDVGSFEPGNVYAHIEALSSPEYAGQPAGSRANEKALEYIRNQFIQIGVEPAGVDNSYYQHFSALMPEIDSSPVFAIGDGNGRTIREFVMYEDYRILASGYGSGVDFSGDLILVGHNIFSIDPALFNDRIVVLESVLMTDKKIQHVLENGGKGILFALERDSWVQLQDGERLEKSLSTAGKSGARLMVGNIGRDAYGFLHDLTGAENLFGREHPFAIVPNVTFEAQIRFPIVDTMNLLGRIEGRGIGDRILLLTAAVDGIGTAPAGRYFPGAVNNVSGIATLMEIARVLTEQESSPYKTIVFAAWNGEENQLSGSRYYTDHPVYPLGKTTVIHLDALGGNGGPFVRIVSDSEYGKVLRSKVKLYADDAGLPAAEFGAAHPGSLGPFIDRNVPGVLLTTGEAMPNYYGDTAVNVDMSAVENASLVLLNYLKRDIYRDVQIDYLRTQDRVLLWVLLVALVVSSLITAVFHSFPDLKIRNLSMEQVFFHPTAEFLRKSIYYLLPIGLAVFLLVLLVNLPPNGSVETVNGETVTNYSSYLSVKEAVYFLRALVRADAGSTSAREGVLSVTLPSGFRSLKLIAASLLLSLCVGIGRAVFENFRRRRAGPPRTIGTLLFASVPDVAVVLAGLWFYVFTAQQFPELKQFVNLKDFILPMVTLSVLPAAYISRIAFIAIQEERKKEYVRHAKGKGYSRAQVLAYELMPAVVSSVLDAVPTLMTVILTNLIIVEYLFDYQGIIYYLLYFYRRQDGSSFVILALSVGVLYVFFAGLARLAAYLINPMKRNSLL